MDIYTVLRVDDSAWDDSVNRYGLILLKLTRQQDGLLYWEFQLSAWGRYPTIWDRPISWIKGVPVLRTLVRHEEGVIKLIPYQEGDI